MVREHELDGVILATWPNLHREQVLGCLGAGVRAILCEKALALSGAEALELWIAANEAQALLVEGYMYRHHPAIRKIDELVAAGRVGELDSISAAFSLFDAEQSSPDDPTRDWRQRKECGGGVPYDLACYCVDACNRLAGAAPRRVSAVARTSVRYGTTAGLYGLIEYENGVVGIVASSKTSDFDHELKVSGTRGHLALPVAWRIDHPTELVLRRSVGWGVFETTEFPVPVVDAYRLQLQAFAAAVRGEVPPLPSLAESVLGAYTTDTLLTSAAEHAALPVHVPEAVAA
jgi:predicted dehydrogenase